MRFGVGNVGQGLTLAALVAGLMTGCAAEDAGPDASGASAKTTAKVAQRGGSVGARGSACELPVTFDIAEFWKAEAVDAGEATTATGDLADLAGAFLRQGPVTMACEVDAKPAGKIGFLRVWTGKPGAADARAVLEGFVAAEKEASGAKYGTFEAGDVTGAEVEYVTTSKLLEESKKEHALAVTTAEGPVVLHLGGMDTAEHEAMLPAYELAKSTLHATG
ncbi:lipoprotein [Streptomyces sp. NBC_00377]|uniref:lipoprotein n=1 Tax=unclassified Streptomyces TaxID=2593676 RepID=UPI002E1E05A3|nr:MULTISPECIES: lipoprotein [unclassified Streptomyces]